MHPFWKTWSYTGMNKMKAICNKRQGQKTNQSGGWNESITRFQLNDSRELWKELIAHLNKFLEQVTLTTHQGFLAWSSHLQYIYTSTPPDDQILRHWNNIWNDVTVLCILVTSIVGLVSIHDKMIMTGSIHFRYITQLNSISSSAYHPRLIY